MKVFSYPDLVKQNNIRVIRVGSEIFTKDKERCPRTGSSQAKEISFSDCQIKELIQKAVMVNESKTN